MSPDKRTGDWSRLILPGSGRKYFYNVATGESRWDLKNEGGPYSNVNPYAPNGKPMSLHRVSYQPQHYYKESKSLNDGIHQIHNYSANQEHNSSNDNTDHYGIRNRRQQYSYGYMTPPRSERHRSQGPCSLPRPSCHRTRQPHHIANSTGRWSLSKPAETTRRNTADFNPQYNVSNKRERNHRKTTQKAPSYTNQGIEDLFQSSTDQSKPDKYNKDYIRLSHEYKLSERYRIKPNSSRSLDSPRPICLSCQNTTQRIDKVLFPCEHACICTSCLKSSVPQKCPLCKENIRRVFDLDGKESENYWKWIEEVGAVIIYFQRHIRLTGLLIYETHYTLLLT